MTTRLRSESGFTLVEMLVATGLLLVVSSIVTQALLQITNQQQTIWNRTEMHSGVRGATELLQQEVGQAGRIALPNQLTSAAVGGFDPTTIADCQHLVVSLNCVGVCTTDSSGNPGNPTDGLWFDAATNASILLTYLDGQNSETVRVEAIPANNQIQACFWENHIANAPVVARGSFANGIVPPSPPNGPNPRPNGSDGNHLKLFGDINGDGKMVYIEYVCDNGDIPGRPPGVASNNLYRNVMAFDTPAAAKPVINNSMILLSNVIQNPLDVTGGPRPCFAYQYPNPATMPVQGAQVAFVLDVAVTLTVQTQSLDPITKQYQQETKALLNVSPRNVFFAWELASIGYTDRVQSTPATVASLMAVVSTP
jgi:prepilin-type N-terminal cleavage/methylation domain-containing protein